MACVVGPFGAPFFITKGRDEAERREDFAEGRPVGELGFGFDAMLVAVFADAVVGNAFVSEDPAAAVLTDAEDFAALTQTAVGGVVEGVALEAAWGDEMEADGGKRRFQLGWIADAELDFGFNCHCAEYKRQGIGRDASDGRRAVFWAGDNEPMPATLRLRVNPHEIDQPGAQQALDLAATILRGGGTVALPTETVYGLGANALNAEAVAKIFAAKERPPWDPLIVHVADEAMLAEVVAEIPEAAQRLIAAFWPGPLTLLLPRSARVPDVVTAGRPLVGVRMPKHPVALEVIQRAGVPVAAPSANRFGHTSPTTAEHVLDDLDGRIDAVVDAGPTDFGVESTVADATESPVVIYRPGAITLEQIRAVAGSGEMFLESEALAEEPREALPSPGVGLRHYAPKARLVLVDVAEDGSDWDEKGWNGKVWDEKLTALNADHSGERIGVMLPSGIESKRRPDRDASVETFDWGSWADDEELAQRLFAGLRQLDAAGCAVILCPVPQGDGIAVAIRDRLRKAAWKP